MRNSIAISLQNISKKYRLFGSPKERLFEALHPFNKKYHREFWALKDISFDVSKGMTLGIIGRNGSGKSTLLQIICSVLQPTSGKVTINGRISALLELGAGFNPEFTGRQNVLMNGRVVGFSKAEMEERLPLIKAFADIGEFFDQPVKIYSSGMFVRLAFAAAINVDPDILIVDEALAVGDAKFQHKCYQKFIEFQNIGKSIIFVTHELNAIVKHCDYAILLENGSIIKSGKPKDITNSYYDLLFTGTLSQNINPESNSTVQPQTENRAKHEQSQLEKFLEEITEKDNCIYRNSYNKNEYRFGDNRAEIIDYLVVSSVKCDPTEIRSGDLIDIYLKAKFHQAIEIPLFGFSINTIDGIVVYGNNTWLNKTNVQPAKKNDIIILKFSMKMHLTLGDFFIDLGIGEVLNGEMIPIDRRCSIIHLFSQEKNCFAGFVDFESIIQNISKTSITGINSNL